MVARWPEAQCEVYHMLRVLESRFEGERWFVRTSNADGFFVKNGFSPERLSTPAGRVSVLAVCD